MISYAVIGAHIKEARLRLGLSQAEVAHRIGKSTSYYGRIERGDIKPNVNRIADISQTLNVPIEDLFRNSVIPEAEILDNTPISAEEFYTYMQEIGEKTSDRVKSMIMRISGELSALDVNDIDE